MPRKLYLTLFDRQSSSIAQEEYNLSIKKARLQKEMAEAKNYATEINKVINIIQTSAVQEEIKTQLINLIEQLELLLSKELDNPVLLKKYSALAAMLQEIVLHDPLVHFNKAQVLDTFITEFRAPSSQTIYNVKRGVIIGTIVLLIGVLAANIFLVPLIPIAAGLTAIGLSGTALTLASAFCNFVMNFTTMGIAAFALATITKKILEPLCNWSQQWSEEYKTAVSVKQTMAFFIGDQNAVTTTAKNEVINIEQTFDETFSGDLITAST